MKSLLRAIAVHRRQQNLARAAVLCLMGPLGRISARRNTSSTYPCFETGRASFYVDRYYHSLRTKSPCDVADQGRIGNRRRVDGDLVRSSLKNRRGILQVANASTNSERDEQVFRRVSNRLQQSLPIV